MIVTVTLNPGLDLTYTLAEPSLGAVDVHRATASTLEASGKGVNVSRTLARAGHATVAVLPAGGETGKHLVDLLDREGVESVVVPVQGDTRVNTSLLLSSNSTVKVNGPGHVLQRADVDALLERLDETLGALGDLDEQVWVAVCGSLPPGTPAEVVGEIVDLAHRRGARCVADVSGPALAAAFGARADLLAPNGLELGALLGTDPSAGRDAEPGTEPSARRNTDLGAEPGRGGVDAVTTAAAELARAGHCALLVSLGADGAVFTDGSHTVRGSGPPLVPVNTAGTGDAFLAGWLAAAGTPERRMARALAYGRSACLSPHTVDPDPATKGLDGITVTTIDDREPEGDTP